MAAITLDDLRQDQLVMSVARALALANATALTQNFDPANSLVTITEDCSAAGRIWQVHYGPRDYVHRRGGDLTVFIEESAGKVQRILRGQ